MFRTGVGQMGYGVTVTATGLSGGTGYTAVWLWKWMWSEATGGSGGERCVLFADPCYANIK